MKQNVFPRQRMWLSGQDSEQERLLSCKMGVSSSGSLGSAGRSGAPLETRPGSQGLRRGSGGRGGLRLHRAVVTALGSAQFLGILEQIPLLAAQHGGTGPRLCRARG